MVPGTSSESVSHGVGRVISLPSLFPFFPRRGPQPTPFACRHQTGQSFENITHPLLDSIYNMPSRPGQHHPKKNVIPPSFHVISVKPCYLYIPAGTRQSVVITSAYLPPIYNPLPFYLPISSPKPKTSFINSVTKSWSQFVCAVVEWMMCRIHPAECKCGVQRQPTAAPPVLPGLGCNPSAAAGPDVLTVWNKSSMAFQGTDGFSVYDRSGRLAFRVDNYARRSNRLTGDVVLMDGDGKALLTLRPQIFSLHDRWNGYKGDYGTRVKPRTQLFYMKRRALFQTNEELEVFLGHHTDHMSEPDFTIEGCFSRRSCRIRQTSTGEVAAEITRKKVNKTVILSDDVFSLVVNPGFDSELVMAFVVIMDRICQKPFTPIMCS